jgi:predicted amidohydrolase YtcJ
MPFQGKIYIENGVISAMEAAAGYVEIIEDGKSKIYPKACVYPAFVDAHCHLGGLGMKLSENDFSGCRSAEECCTIALNGERTRQGWVTGRGWNQELWQDNQLPNSNILDKFFPKEPVCFTRIDGHAVWVNTKALELAGIDQNTNDPIGGKISRDSDGNANGILLDNAIPLVQLLIPEYSRSQAKRFIELAQDELLRVGIAAVHDMDVEPIFLDVIKEMAANDELKINVYSYVRAHDNELDWTKPEVIGRLNICGAKYFIDGALGSRSAALIEPYSDDASTNGVLILDEEKFYQHCLQAIGKGFDIAVHAIGDAANKVAINVYKRLIDEGKAGNTILRLEHAQTISPEDLEKLADSCVICSVQPIHCTSDARMAEKRLGARINNAYRWRSLVDSGLMLVGGSDFPVESHDPLLGIDAFVNRIPIGENESWLDKEKITLPEALEAYTCNTYKAVGSNCGNLRIGQKSSLVLLDRQLNENNILDANIIKTIVL